ncbi:MAG: hypothetical protein JJE36_01355 [Coriobacteriia bacterium]|nr:hypothetical protein [Coriobacteriia bacterium]
MTSTDYILPGITAALLAKGARIGVVVAIVSTWAIKLPMIQLELRLFGWKFTLLCEGLLFVSAFIMAPLMELIIGKDWGARFRDASQEEASTMADM